MDFNGKANYYVPIQPKSDEDYVAAECKRCVSNTNNIIFISNIQWRNSVLPSPIHFNFLSQRFIFALYWSSIDAKIFVDSIVIQVFEHWNCRRTTTHRPMDNWRQSRNPTAVLLRHLGRVNGETSRH